MLPNKPRGVSRVSNRRVPNGIFYGPEGNVFNDLGENPPVLESYAQRSNALDVPTAASLFSAGCRIVSPLAWAAAGRR